MSEQGDTFTNEAPEASVISASSAPKRSLLSSKPVAPKGPNIFVRFFRSVFGYRKTSLSFFVFVTLVAVYLLSFVDNNLDLTVSLPTDELESSVLDISWETLQNIAKFKHPYGSEGNNFVHDYLKDNSIKAIKKFPYMEYDDDLNKNSILFKSDANVISYHESNNFLVRINGTNPDLPALLLSAHYDSVPSSYGVTDDGVGIASLYGILEYYTKVDQPARTLIFNFNNHEEFGLYGASAFLAHSWCKDVEFFINLEGTGQGGKAILFRGTDYGITKEYGAVRYPYASSIFQQAFNSRVIHSETDYKIYKEGGLRGIDIAFYKPRDIYHTQYDDIRHTSKTAVWHMLSSALDFVVSVGSKELDIDQPYLEDETAKTQFASFVSFLNFFFIISLPTLIKLNIALLVIAPVVSSFLLLIIFGYKQNWRLGFVNSIKFPLSLVISIILIDFVNKFLWSLFEFLPNSDANNMMITLASTFLFINYLVLNSINFIFKSYKVIQHDEKLIVILQVSFIYWVLLIVSTVRLAGNRAGFDHTGEAVLTLLFVIQSIGAIFGLLGWCFKASKRELEYELLEAGATQPLLVSDNHEYDAVDGHHVHPGSDNSSLISVDSYTARKDLSLIQKTFSYDWFIQYLIVAPIPMFIIYNNGWLILSGVCKSVQESYKSETLIFNLIEYISIACVLPLLPFVFKINRFIIYILIVGTVINTGLFFIISPFNTSNPMKLRFLQSANLAESSTDSFVHVSGRIGNGYEDILKDMPSVKSDGTSVTCVDQTDGMYNCGYKTSLQPKLIEKAKDFSDYLSVDVLKNSSSAPYGLLNGEISINAKGSSICAVNFNSAKTKDFPVKTVMVYLNDTKNETQVSASATPDGFSQDKNGNYIYKDLSGIKSMKLNKIDGDKPFHIAFQWLPNLIDEYDGEANSNLKVGIDCYWSELGIDNSLVPAYQELVDYSPLFVSWANAQAGMVSVSTTIEI